MDKTLQQQARHRRLGQVLTLLLRPRPARVPIQVDDEGYADLGEIMRILHGLPNFRWATRSDVDAVVSTSGRRRFEIAGNRIRALYGHTTFRPTYEPVTPPDVLYHGTAPENLAAIRREGLRPMERQYVHLAATPETGRSIALRHTAEPVILRIDAAAAYADGIAFYHPVPEIYLCDKLPAQYVSVIRDRS